MLLGLLIGILVVVSLWLAASSKKKEERESIHRWEKENKGATKEQIEFESQCRQIVANGNLSGSQRKKLEKWREQNPSSTLGEIASKIIEIKH